MGGELHNINWGHLLGPDSNWQNKPKSDDTVLLSFSDGAAEVIVPGGDWLLAAEFVREGSDLVLVGRDGAKLLIQDYFSQETPPNLVTDGGAVVPAALAIKLAGPVAPMQFAQMADGISSDATGVNEPIGRVENITGTVKVVHADGSEETLAVGDAVFQGDVLVSR